MGVMGPKIKNTGVPSGSGGRLSFLTVCTGVDAQPDNSIAANITKARNFVSNVQRIIEPSCNEQTHSRIDLRKQRYYYSK